MKGCHGRSCPGSVLRRPRKQTQAVAAHRVHSRMMASHADGVATTTSILAFTMEAAVSGDVLFHRWVKRHLDGMLGPPAEAQPIPLAMFHNPPPQQPAPPPDVWAQMAQGLANVAAAMHPPLPQQHANQPVAYDEGGKVYDPYQLTILQGFSHAPTMAGIQPIWSLFQATKHLDTHKDNLKKKMKDWGERHHVPIDRGLLFLNATMREILALKFNPGNTTAVYSSAEQGMSLLICRTRSGADKDSIRLRELAEELSKHTRTLADAEKMTKHDPRAAPEDYNELSRCLGTYCALLHALFGPRCEFYAHCFRLWRTLDSDHVSDRRQYFTPLLCRQLTWAIIEDGRSYFALRLSPDDFIVPDPAEINFPISTVLELEPYIRHQTAPIRSTFPMQWSRDSPAFTANITHAPQPTLDMPPPHIVLGSVPTPSVVSVISAGASTQRTQSQQGVQRLPGIIRQTNIHAIIRSAMERYIV